MSSNYPPGVTGNEPEISGEDMVDCTRCETPTPDSELIELGSWWVCGTCFDDI